MSIVSIPSAAVSRISPRTYRVEPRRSLSRLAGRGAELGASDDAMTQILWRQVRAKVLGPRGERDEAEQLARAAVAIGEEADMLNMQGTRTWTSARCSTLRKANEAVAALEQAVERYERKEISSRLGTRRRDSPRSAPPREHRGRSRDAVSPSSPRRSSTSSGSRSAPSARRSTRSSIDCGSTRDRLRLARL
jgi:hypothetical protein